MTDKEKPLPQAPDNLLRFFQAITRKFPADVIHHLAEQACYEEDEPDVTLLDRDLCRRLWLNKKSWDSYVATDKECTRLQAKVDRLTDELRAMGVLVTRLRQSKESLRKLQETLDALDNEEVKLSY